MLASAAKGNAFSGSLRKTAAAEDGLGDSGRKRRRMSPKRPCASTIASAALVAIVSLVPFVRGLVRGESFYFRDLASIFIPFREYVVEGLRSGELRYWNALDHEGVPLPYPPVSYPLDLVQAVIPGPFGLTLLLALHVPLAALGAFVLARTLGLSRTAAAAAGLIYSLGGFCLSTVNLYVYVEGAAWVPLALAALLRAAEGGRRRFAWAAASMALLVSTMTIEFVAQTIVIAGVLVFRRRETARRLVRVGIPIAVGCALAAPTLLVMREVLRVSGRGAGFDASVTLAQSVHPFTFLQVVVAGLYGDLESPTHSWWGENFFPVGFPYFLSLYLGAAVLTLAWAGLRHGEDVRRRLALLVLLGAVVCLGRYAGMEPLVRALPILGAVRFPVKAYLTVHLALALLAALGVDAMARQPSRAGRSLALVGLGSCALLALGPRLLLLALPDQGSWFVSAFFPVATPWPQRLLWLEAMLRDASVGGLLGGFTGLVGLATATGRLRVERGQWFVVAAAVADLWRAGAGLNPTTRTSFFRLSEEMAPVAASLREGGRVWVCAPEKTSAYWRARAQLSDHELWTFAVRIETFTPHLNMISKVSTAFTEDLTSLVPLPAVPPGENRYDRFAAFADRLRQAGVTRVVSVDPLDSSELRLERVVSPRRIAPLSVFVYQLAGSLPRLAVVESVADGRAGTSATSAAETKREPRADDAASAALGSEGRVSSVVERPGRIELRVDAARPAMVVVRDTWSPGWTALVNGSPTLVEKLNGLHRAVAVPAGRSTVLLEYRPPGLRAGMIVAGLGLLALVLGVVPLGTLRKAAERREKETASRGPGE